MAKKTKFKGPVAEKKRKDPAAEGIKAFLNSEQMYKLSRVVLQSRYVVEGNLSGAHRSPLKGASSEFAEHKAYGIGDDPKHIDWKVFGRTDRYYVKRYEDETNLRVYIILDRSGSMAYGSGDVRKFDFACQLAAAMGYVVVKANDSVGMFVFSDKIDMKVEPRNSLNHLHNMLKRLQDVKAESPTNTAKVLHQIAESIHKRALVILISDLLDDEKEVVHSIAHFRKQKHDVIVLHVLDPVEIDLSLKQGFEFEDMETGEKMTVDPRGVAKDYQKEFGAFLEHYRVSCQGMKVDYRLVKTDQQVDTYARAYLEERRRLR
ncbi:MAG: DUF58 domain-containing protein [Kiritimatiellae bacterium]|jgi:uncharacterized protein (DUF58 family)|nr:DUF58 domain-containing protein [Kiritimatiellia bacterium]